MQKLVFPRSEMENVCKRFRSVKDSSVLASTIIESEVAVFVICLKRFSWVRALFQYVYCSITPHSESEMELQISCLETWEKTFELGSSSKGNRKVEDEILTHVLRGSHRHSTK